SICYRLLAATECLVNQRCASCLCVSQRWRFKEYPSDLIRFIEASWLYVLWVNAGDYWEVFVKIIV
ncbi:MAG: hypothetical protein ACJAWQ_002457, partial [Paraglaciecola sp.]